MYYFKTLINSNNRRFIDRKYNLDLSYITPRIIAMGFPTTFPKSLLKNSVTDVADFLNERHGNSYLLIDLSEKKYDASLFKGMVEDYQMINNKSPDLLKIFEICEKIYDYLNRDIFNIIALKCKEGKGYVGVIICCFFLYIKKFKKLEDAFHYYSYKRLYKGEAGISQPSHKRYVNYFFNILTNKIHFPFRIKITSIVLENMYEIYNNGDYKVEYWDYRNKKYQEIIIGPDDYEYDFEEKSVNLKMEKFFTEELYGDVDIKISYNEILFVKKLGKISFNTAFIEKYVDEVDFESNQIDEDNILIDPDSLLKKQKLPKGYNIQIYFKKLCKECPFKDKNKYCQSCHNFFEQNPNLYKNWEDIMEYKKKYINRNLVYNEYILFGSIDKDDSESALKKYEENKNNKINTNLRNMSDFNMNNNDNVNYIEEENNDESNSDNDERDNFDNKDNNSEENKKKNKLNDSFESECFIF